MLGAWSHVHSGAIALFEYWLDLAWSAKMLHWRRCVVGWKSGLIEPATGEGGKIAERTYHLSAQFAIPEFYLFAGVNKGQLDSDYSGSTAA